MSSLTIGQQDLRNCPLKPSGPGALSIGNDLTTTSISAFVKGEESSSRPGVG
jgi:hypothetical protein